MNQKTKSYQIETLLILTQFTSHDRLNLFGLYTANHMMHGS